MSQLTTLINPYAKKSKEQTLLTTQLHEHNNSASTTQCDIDQIGTQYSEASNDQWTTIQFTKNLKPTHPQFHSHHYQTTNHLSLPL
jgi:hypothetical protein